MCPQPHTRAGRGTVIRPPRSAGNPRAGIFAGPIFHELGRPRDWELNAWADRAVSANRPHSRPLDRDSRFLAGYRMEPREVPARAKRPADEDGRRQGPMAVAIAPTGEFRYPAQPTGLPAASAVAPADVIGGDRSGLPEHPRPARCPRTRVIVPAIRSSQRCLLDESRPPDTFRRRRPRGLLRRKGTGMTRLISRPFSEISDYTRPLESRVRHLPRVMIVGASHICYGRSCWH
jgi:hypothetical protein